MDRKDVTNNKSRNFKTLSAELRAQGFAVDHYHAVDIDDHGDEHIVHIDDVGDSDRLLRESPCGWTRLVADEYHEH